MFYYRLARELGMTVSRLLSEASSAEIAGWMACLEVEDELAEQRRQDAKNKQAAAGEAVLKARLTQAGQAAAAKLARKKKAGGDG